jgi:RNA polymerase sigma-70 factor (ECF subfamily)
VTPHETLLVLRAQANDRRALDDLLRSVQAPLFRYVLRVVGDRGLAEDALQETFLRICRKVRWLDDPSLFRPWAFRIASREAFRTLKRETRRNRWLTSDDDLEVQPAIHADPPPRIDASELARLIEATSPASRAVLVLHYIEDLTIDEVAAVLDLSSGTVKSRLSYGLRTLRRAVREKHG